MRLKITTAVTALVLVASAGVAAATVVIYSNDFSSRKEFRSVQKFEGGKPCRKFWRDKKTFGVKVKNGPLQCDFRTPLSGDSKEPDHEIEAAATVLDSTSRGARRDAYVGVAVRADKSSRYELRVFPDTRTFELRRRPGGGEFPIRGTNAAIARTGKENKLKLRAFGDRVTALVNKTRVVPEVVDPEPRRAERAQDADRRGTRRQLGQGRGGVVQRRPDPPAVTTRRRLSSIFDGRGRPMSTTTVEKPRSAGPDAGLGGPGW